MINSYIERLLEGGVHQTVFLNQLLIENNPAHLKKEFSEGKDALLCLEDCDLSIMKALWAAVCRGDVVSVDRLLLGGAYAHTVYLQSMDNAKSCLAKAIENDAYEIAELLIQNGANANFGVIKPGEAQSNLSLAIKKGWKDIVTLLLDNGAYINDGDWLNTLHCSPVYIAISSPHADALEIARQLIIKGANLTCSTQPGFDEAHSLLYWAIVHNKHELLELLLQREVIGLDSEREIIASATDSIHSSSLASDHLHNTLGPTELPEQPAQDDHIVPSGDMASLSF